MNQKELINYLDQIRRDKNLTQQALGDRIGKHRVQVSSFFKMKNAATLEMTIDIAESLGVKIEPIIRDILKDYETKIDLEFTELSCGCRMEGIIFRKDKSCRLTKTQHKF